jgi:hypothetical protein
MPDVFLVVMNVTLIVFYFFDVGVTVGAVVIQVAAVVAGIGAIFGQTGGIAGSFVAGNVGAVVI